MRTGIRSQASDKTQITKSGWEIGVTPAYTKSWRKFARLSRLRQWIVGKAVASKASLPVFGPYGT